MGGVHRQVALPAVPARGSVHLGALSAGQLVDVAGPAVLLLHAVAARTKQRPSGDAATSRVRVLFFLWFPFRRSEPGLLVTSMYGYFCNNHISIGPRCWPFLSTFVPPLPFSDLSSHIPPILAVVFLVFCNLRASLSLIFSVICHLSL